MSLRLQIILQKEWAEERNKRWKGRRMRGEEKGRRNEFRNLKMNVKSLCQSMKERWKKVTEKTFIS